ncbi:MAG: sensor histidine kinase [Clostridia bacterium]|nr:sensor histidine kinase [Clostridia bacterium]
MMKGIYTKLKSKSYIGIIIITLSIICSAVVILNVFWDYQKTIVLQQQERLLTIAQSVSRSIEIYIDNYIIDLNAIENDELFKQALSHYSTHKGTDALTPIVRKYVNDQKPNIKDLLIYDEDENLIAADQSNNAYKKIHTINQGASKIHLHTYSDKRNTYYLGISKTLLNGYTLTAVLDIKTIYNQIVSHVKVGEKGYVMIKDSKGIILMHPVTSQIGQDVVVNRKAAYPDYEFSGLKNLFEKQLEGEEGILVYRSYWWTESDPKDVTKISAFTPVNVEDDFLIVSTVMDYNEIVVPVTIGVVKILILALLMLIGLFIFVAILIRSIRSKKQYERENEHLRELNQTLEEVHKSEEQIAHYQRLQTIGTLTGGIAHEFNNLLTPIMGYSGRILSVLPKKDALYEDIEEIYNASIKAKEIIMQISSLNRKNASINYRYLLADDVIKGSLKIVESTKPKNIQIKKIIEFDNIKILGNETQINQVILNLCINAFHAMTKKGGTLTIQSEIVDTHALQNKLLSKKNFHHYLKLSFSDTGEGMEEKIIKRIFDPFFTTKNIGEGTGLGLSIAQSIIESHSGLITAESVKDQGSTFTIYLPVFTGKYDEVEKSKKQACKNRLLIVLVEYDLQQLKMLEKSFIPFGYQIKSFNNALEAIKDMEKNSYDVFITDYAMSQILGAKLVIGAKKLHPTIKILIVTNVVDKELLEYRKEKIIDAYVIKPLICHDIADKIEELLKDN